MNTWVLDFSNLSLKLLILFLSTARSSGELRLVRATGLIKSTKKSLWIENERLCHFWVDILGKGHSTHGSFHLHFWTFSSPMRDRCHFIWSWDREELQFTAEISRTSACLAHLFSSNLESQCGQGVIQLWI